MEQVAMPQENDTKTCKMCGMSIPATARKCPYCHHWQHWMNVQHPAIVALLFMLPMIAALAILGSIVGRPFREWEPFSKHLDQIRIVEEKMEFGDDQCGPVVIVVGRVENHSPIEWKDVRFEVEFLDSKGELFDAGQQETFTWRLPAGQNNAFKVSFRRQFPEKKYASHNVRIVSAVDGRNWP